MGKTEAEETFGVAVHVVDEVNSSEYDAVVVLVGAGLAVPQALEDFVAAACELDAALNKQKMTAVLHCTRVSGDRLVVSSLGPQSPYDDVRSVGEAARAGVARAAAAGARRTVLALPAGGPWPRAPLVALLGGLEALYVPRQLRDEWGAAASSALAAYGEGGLDVVGLVRAAAALEAGRALARDVGGGDPEHMTPARAAHALAAAFAGSAVRARVLDDAEELRARYPLLAAVARAAHAVPRHRACVLYLDYQPGHYERTAMFVGKGVTYDTGGADVKTGGAMAGMSRDKCGAAAIAGFLKTCEALRAPVRVSAALGFVRNSVGADAYVADELLRSRGGRPVLVGNTDAEGRLVMADLLDEMRERAAAARAPHLYTVATLTGHAARAVGPYGVALDNSTAAGTATRLAAAGLALGEPLEVSTVRREDLAAHKARAPALAAADALLQAAPGPSTAVARGHQGPAAFLLLAAGLAGPDAPPFTHLDVAGSAGDLPDPPTAAPLLALAEHYGLLAR